MDPALEMPRWQACPGPAPAPHTRGAVEAYLRAASTARAEAQMRSLTYRLRRLLGRW